MSRGTPRNLAPETSRSIGLVLRRSVASAFVPAFFLFGSAGRLNWPMGWVYVGLTSGVQVATTLLLYFRSPGLLAERSRMRKGTKPWDRLIVPIIVFFGPVAFWIVGGLDFRFAWSRSIPPAASAAAAAVCFLGVLLVQRAMLANPFFAVTVRIQTERGHRVIATGPYAYVRHPGYSGWLVAIMAAPFVLGSLWSLIPTACMAVLVVLRTVLEDRTLQRELEGYKQYAARVRWRLAPGLW